MKNRITNAIVVQDKLREKSEGWSGVKEIRKWREKRCLWDLLRHLNKDVINMFKKKEIKKEAEAKAKPAAAIGGKII